MPAALDRQRSDRRAAGDRRGRAFLPGRAPSRRIREGRGEPIVAAQEIEFELTPRRRPRAGVDADTPELYFCDDLEGYGWCFRKGNCAERRPRPAGHASARRARARFRRGADRGGRIPADLPWRWKGHAYLLARRIAAAAGRRRRDADRRRGGPRLRAQRGRDPPGGGIGAAGGGCRERSARAWPLRPRRPRAVSRAAAVTLRRRRRRGACQLAACRGAARREPGDRAGAAGEPVVHQGSVSAALVPAGGCAARWAAVWRR